MKHDRLFPFRVLLSAAVILFLALSPRWLAEHNAVDHYRTFYEKPAPDWYGAVELWHIVGFRTYQGSVTDFLQNSANRYCDAHPGVHINVTGMSETAYAERTARGERPDGYSFPVGLLYREQLHAIEADWPAYAAGLRNAADDSGVYAVPFFLSAYVLIANTQRASTLTTDGAIPPLAQLLDPDEANSELSVPDWLAADAGLLGAPVPYERFGSGNAAYAVADLRALGDLERRTKNAIPVTAEPFPGPSDLVQYLGVSGQTDAKRAEVLADFFAFLLTGEEQRLLPSLGALPAVRDVSDVSYSARIITGCYERLSETRTPDPFLYQQQKEAIWLDARAALSGEAGAADSFRERMAVVFTA